jgi:O-antigen biosynthesis protein
VRHKLSAVVISYNRAAVIGTCLRALGFADEVIVVDKSSTDATPQIAARHADRVICVPWTPTVEDTRAFAVDQCSGDWILCLDDDECLSPDAAAVILAELAAPRADIYYLPLRHYILGTHDEAAYYWPEHHPRLFCRGAIAFTATVHGGMQLRSDKILHLPPESGAVIHHLSHRDVAEWIDKCNRYTSRPDRQRPVHDGNGLAAFAHARIEHWQSRSQSMDPGGYPAAVAMLRAVYDIVDRLKTWEEEHGLDGTAAFARICCELDAAYKSQPGAAPRAGALLHGTPPPPMPQEAAARGVLLSRVAELRTRCEALHSEATRWEAEASRLNADLADTAGRHRLAEQALADERGRNNALAREAYSARHHAEAADRDAASARTQAAALHARLTAIESSTSWRATSGVRRIGECLKRVAQRRPPRRIGSALSEWSE